MATQASSAALAEPSLDQAGSLLLRLPNELLYKIGRDLLRREWEDQAYIRSLRRCSKQLAIILRPLIWKSHQFSYDIDQVHDSTPQLLTEPNIQRRVHKASWQYPSLLPFTILPSLSNLRLLYIRERSNSTVVPAPVTRLLSVLPSVTHLSLHGFHSFADDTFSLAAHAPSVQRLHIFQPGHKLLIPGGERLRHVCSETIIGIAEIFHTVRSLDLVVSPGEIIELAQSFASRPPSAIAMRFFELGPVDDDHDFDLEDVRPLLQALVEASSLVSITVTFSSLTPARELGEWTSVSLPSVRSVSLQQVGNDWLELILRSFPRLRTLQLYGSWTIPPRAELSALQLFSLPSTPAALLPGLQSFLDHLLADTVVEELRLKEGAGPTTEMVFTLHRKTQTVTSEVVRSWPVYDD